MGSAPTNLPAIPLSFKTKKANILQALAAPSYSDASPKGSVDTGILDLIDRINAFEGLVTTSSCAGRINVFLEGAGGREEQRGNPGGKGGGQWLFVSHDPVAVDQRNAATFTSRFGLIHNIGSSPTLSTSNRLIRFQYEPLILHILCASLAHAQPILAAAISSGFRESGVQSLKNLDDPDALPMVAIRSHGLALESIIGYFESSEGPTSLVSEEFILLLLNTANERFRACEARKKRFESALFGGHVKKGPTWEDADIRRMRKREEGFKKKQEKALNTEAARKENRVDSNDPDVLLIEDEEEN